MLGNMLKLENAMEIEVLRNGGLTEILDTEDGSLGSVFQEQPLSSAMIDLFYPLDENQIAQKSWRDLSIDLKNQILALVSQEVDFEVDRTLKGFASLREVDIVALKDFSFLGKNYTKGQSYRVILKGFLMPLVEYAASTLVRGAAGLEFHFRSSRGFLDFRRDVETFFNAVVPSIKGECPIRPLGLHMHILSHAPKPKKNPVDWSPERVSISMTIYVQMAELAFMIENAASYRTGLDLVPNIDPKKPPLVDFLSKDSLVIMYQFFLNLIQGHDTYLGTCLKKNIIGVRSGEVYDTEGLWGLELRFNRFSNSATDKMGFMADALTKAMHRCEILVSEDAVDLFMKKHHEDIISGLKKYWFRGPAYAQVQENMEDPELAQLMVHYLKSVGIVDFPKQSKGFLPSAQVLFLDWASHPVIATLGDCHKVRLIQKAFLLKSADDKGMTVADMALFFRETGIEDIVAHTLLGCSFDPVLIDAGSSVTRGRNHQDSDV